MIIHDPLFPFDADRVREIRVFVFDDAGGILCVKKGRRISVPSGRMEWDDDDFEDAAKREVYEQTTILLDRVTLAAIVEETDYTLIMAGRVPNANIEQSPHTAFLNKETFLNRYAFGAPDELRQIVKSAEEAARDLSLPSRSQKYAK